MTSEMNEPWLNWLAITTIIFSACATLATFYGGKFSNRSVLSQTKAANMWAFFQAKSIKQYSYELQKDQFEIDSLSADSEKLIAYREHINDYLNQIARYEAEKKQAMDSARAFEVLKSEYQNSGSIFSLSVVFLQVAIVLSALSALLKKKYIWVVGVVIGCIGLLNFMNGFWHFIN